jgi:PAS domain-containing protein
LVVPPQRVLQAHARGLEQRNEELADRDWELKETEERSRSFLEAQGDFIVRRDTNGRITYANDALLALAERGREFLLGSDFALPLLEQGESTFSPDGARIYDQKIATAEGRAGSPGAKFRYGSMAGWKSRASDATSPTALKRNSRWRKRATRRKPPIAPSHASSPWSRMKSARR